MQFTLLPTLRFAAAAALLSIPCAASAEAVRVDFKLQLRADFESPEPAIGSTGYLLFDTTGLNTASGSMVRFNDVVWGVEGLTAAKVVAPGVVAVSPSELVFASRQTWSDGVVSAYDDIAFRWEKSSSVAPPSVPDRTSYVLISLNNLLGTPAQLNVQRTLYHPDGTFGAALYWYDVNVVSVQVVPEPATFGLTLVGLCAASAAAWRARRVSRAA